jgi:hypothetical protein
MLALRQSAARFACYRRHHLVAEQLQQSHDPICGLKLPQFVSPRIPSRPSLAQRLQAVGHFSQRADIVSRRWPRSALFDGTDAGPRRRGFELVA